MEYSLHRGDIVKFAAVLTRLRESENEVDQVCRYDNAHGFVHLDLLDKKGKVIEKVVLSETANFNQALTYAIHDLKTSYQQRWSYLEAQR